jgi:hypothetical protein
MRAYGEYSVKIAFKPYKSARYVCRRCTDPTGLDNCRGVTANSLCFIHISMFTGN